jgi:hypothetical protein
MKNKSNIINQIENVRKRNNRCWMDILRLSFKHAPKQAALIMQKINNNDKKISKLISNLSKKK